MDIICPNCGDAYDVEVGGDSLDAELACDNCGTSFTVAKGVEALEQSASLPEPKERVKTSAADLRHYRREARKHKVSVSERFRIPPQRLLILKWLTRPHLAFLYNILWGVVHLPWALEAGPVWKAVMLPLLIILTPLTVWTTCLLLWRLLRALFGFVLLVWRRVRNLPTYIRERVAEQEQAYASGEYISFKTLTQQFREALLGYVICGLMDALMLPFPLTFHQYRLPNLFSERWGKRPFLQTCAVAVFIWVYFISVVEFYGTGVVVFLSWFGDGVLVALLWAAGAMLIASLLVAFSLVFIKALAELVSVFLKIEENTQQGGGQT